jgi:hypothetical protein
MAYHHKGKMPTNQLDMLSKNPQLHVLLASLVLSRSLSAAVISAAVIDEPVISSETGMGWGVLGGDACA